MNKILLVMVATNSAPSHPIPLTIENSASSVSASDVLAAANNTIAVASAYITYSAVLLGILTLAVAVISLLVTWQVSKQQSEHLRLAVKKLVQDKESCDTLLEVIRTDADFNARHQAMVQELIQSETENIKSRLAEALKSTK